jgi:uncharacterized protein
MSRWDSLFGEDLRRRLAEIESACGDGFACHDSWLHGTAHLREVALLAGYIASQSGADMESAMVAGFLHDCGRVDDGGGNRHAHDSACQALAILQKHFPHLDADRLCDTIRCHADGKVTDDPIAGAVWDADRLTLERLGYGVREDMLSTTEGRRLARTLGE